MVVEEKAKEEQKQKQKKQDWDWEKENRVICAVTEGIDSPQTKKKYAYHFRRFLDHFEGVSEASLLAKGEKEPRVLEAMIIQWIRHL